MSRRNSRKTVESALRLEAVDVPSGASAPSGSDHEEYGSRARVEEVMPDRRGYAGSKRSAGRTLAVISKFPSGSLNVKNVSPIVDHAKGSEPTTASPAPRPASNAGDGQESETRLGCRLGGSGASVEADQRHSKESPAFLRRGFEAGGHLFIAEELHPIHLVPINLCFMIDRCFPAGGLGT